ncbi:MAG: type II toxin-antitoxin system RelE/ParE family toxin [Bryobacteraceae bacterium]
MKVEVSPKARADIIRQFRYYLVTQEVPHVAVRFRKAVFETIEDLRRNYRIGKPVVEVRVGMRSWPVRGFESIRLYYRDTSNGLCVVRILHGAQNVRRILAREK